MSSNMAYQNQLWGKKLGYVLFCPLLKVTSPWAIVGGGRAHGRMGWS